ncbi:MAG: lytic transglycosylase [Pseudomonadota bacterium]
MNRESSRRVPRLSLLALVVLTACSGASQGPPANTENACLMKQDRPQWFQAMAKTEARWGAPVHVQMATFYQESTFRPKAKPPRKYFLWIIPAGRVSSAYGYAQAIDGTWDWYRADTGNRRAKRDRFPDASDFMGWYMARSTANAGIAPQDAYRQYLAYHEGHAGYKRGSYSSKAWLQNTAARVQARASKYEQQLRSCP